MTELLNKAFAKASTLPPDAQDELARVMLAQIEDDGKWDAALSSPKGRETLRRLAAEAEADIAAGRTIDGDPATRAE